MYNEKTKSSIAVPEHANVAKAMAEEIISNWNPAEQNSILRLIKEVVAGKRQIEIEETEKRLEYLRGSLEEL